MSESVKKILVLTADAGFGHRSAAIAVADAIKDRYQDKVDVQIINPLEDKRTPFFLRDSQSDYDRWVKEVPELYRFGYEASDSPVPVTILESILTVLLYEVLRDLIKKTQPNVVISTYPLFAAPLEAVRNVAKADIPVINVVTDLATVHQIWFNKDVDVTVVPTNIVESLAKKTGLSDDNIRVTGIPVHPEIAKISKTKKEIRKELGWKEELITVLAVGSKRSNHFIDMLDVLNHTGFQFQFALVAGKDEDLFEDLQNHKWHVPTHIYAFVENMPTLMGASDLVLCKAGGLIVTESVASGLPMLLMDVIHGQETGNAQYVEENRVGKWVKDRFDLLEIFHDLMSNHQKKLFSMQEKAREIGKPEAAYDIADIAWSLSKSVSRPKKKLFANRPGILDLLGSNEINLGERD